MKKILLASTALVAFAGAAAANDNISLSGSAKMGVVGANLSADIAYNDVASGDRIKASGSADTPTQFFQDVDVSFAMSSETDGGLVFGTKVDLDEAGNLGNSFGNQGVAVYLKGDFGTVTLGDTDSAMDAVLLDGDELAGGLGSLNDANTAHLGFNGSYLTTNDGDGQRLAYAYTYEGFTGVVSLEQANAKNSNGGRVIDDDNSSDYTWSVGLGYDYDFGSGSAIFGLAYTASDDGSISFGSDDSTNLYIDDDYFYVLEGESTAWGVSAAIEMENGFSGGVTYVQYDFSDYNDGDLDYLAVGLAYAWEEFAIGANWGQYDNDDVDFNGWGLAMAYDLGGGLEVQAGYGDSSGKVSGLSGDYDDGTGSYENGKINIDSDQWSLGLAMSF